MTAHSPAPTTHILKHAPIFAALGDPTRLALVAALAQTPLCSIKQLADGAKITRQAITQHLRVLERSNLVRSETIGRECLFQLAPEPLDQIRNYLDVISSQWDKALSRLQSPVEK